MDDVAAGHAELGWTGARAFHDLGVRDFDALVAPFLIDSYGLEEKVVRDPLAGRMLDGLDTLGVEGVGVLPGPLRKPLGAEPLLRPDDWAGTTIALTRSAVARRTLRALGADGTEIPSAGAIDGDDGVESQIAAIAKQRVRRHGGRAGGERQPLAASARLFGNADALAGLDARQRAALRAAAADAIGPMLRSRARRRPRRRGHPLPPRRRSSRTASAADLVALRDAVAPVYASLSGDAFTKAAIAHIRALRDGLPPPEEPACSGAGDEPIASGRPSPVDGVWRSDITFRDLERAPGYEDGEHNPGNIGHFRMELRDGSFAVTGSSGRRRRARRVRGARRPADVHLERRGRVLLPLAAVPRRARAAQARRGPDDLRRPSVAPRHRRPDRRRAHADRWRLPRDDDPRGS